MAERKPLEKKARKPMVKWNWMMLVHIYRMVRAEMPDSDICKSLNISRQTLWQWQRDHPELREAIEMARREVGGRDTLPRWIYSRLSAELQEVWDRIVELEGEENGLQKIEMLLQDQGKIARQQLFLHALCVSKFSASAALQRVNLSRTELEKWMTIDTDFALLVEEIQWHKGNFFETALVDLVEQGNPAAVIFANKSYNSGRGYASRSEVDVKHSGAVLHGVLDLAELMPHMTEEVKCALLEAIRKKEEMDERKLRVLSHEEVVSRQIVRLGDSVPVDTPNS